MLRFYDPVEGRITIGGVDLRELHLASVHKHIGVVSQETQLFNSTIAENIAYGAPEHTREELLAAATAAQAHQFISEFEDGYETHPSYPVQLQSQTFTDAAGVARKRVWMRGAVRKAAKDSDALFQDHDIDSQ